MFNKHKQRYVTPAVLQQAELLLEGDLLTGSGIDDAFNLGGIDTASHSVDNTDFSTEGFNFTWESIE